MLSLIIVTIIYNSLLSSVQSTLLKEPTEQTSNPSSSKSPDRGLSSSNKPHSGSFSCHNGRMFLKPEIDDMVENVCEKARLRQLQTHSGNVLDSSAAAPIKNPSIFYTSNSWDIWRYEIPNADDNNGGKYVLHVEQDQSDKSRCFPMAMYLQRREEATGCNYSFLRELIEPKRGVPRAGHYNCGGTIFSANEIKNSIRSFSEAVNQGIKKPVEEVHGYPKYFKDYLFKYETSSWMYPLLKNGELYNKDNPVRYRVVRWRHGHYYGVVYERSLRDRRAEKNLAFAMEYKACKFETSR